MTELTAKEKAHVLADLHREHVKDARDELARLEIALAEARAELDRTTAARDTLKAELTEVLGELAAARDELRARDEAIAASPNLTDQRVPWLEDFFKL